MWILKILKLPNTSGEPGPDMVRKPEIMIRYDEHDGFSNLFLFWVPLGCEYKNRPSGPAIGADIPWHVVACQLIYLSMIR